MDPTTTSSLDLLLQNGLEITAEGRCTRHPEVVLCSKGEITSCSVCTVEQQQQDSMQADASLRTDRLRSYGQVGKERPDFELGVSLSKMVSGQHHEQPLLDSSSRSNRRNNNTNSYSSHILNNSKTNGGDDDDNEENEMQGEQQHHHDDVDDVMDGAGSISSMEKLIARWCQLQDTSSKPNNEMLSSTLILLQLQKLERRVQHQEHTIQDLSSTMQEQQSAIQSDLTRILSYVAVTANNNTNGGMSQQHQQANSNGNHYNSHHHHQFQSQHSNNSNHFKNSVSAPPNTLQVNTNHSGYLPGTVTGASAISALSGSNEENSSHQSQSQAQSFLGSSAAPPTRPASGQKEIVLSPQHNYNRTNTNSLHPSSVFTSVRTMERQPPRPPKRHDSFQSIKSKKSIAANSSAEVSSISSTIPGGQSHHEHLPVQPPTVFVPPPAAASTTETTNGNGPTPAPVEVEKNPSETAADATQVPGALGLTKSRSKSSFRSQTKPQLDIIWDASEHTSGHSPSGNNNKLNNNRPTAGANNNNNNLRNRNFNGNTNNGGATGGPGGKRPPPTLASSLDDDDDDASDDRSAKLFLAVKGYMVDNGPPKLAPINNNDSCLINFSSNNDSCLTGVQSFMDDLAEDDTGNSGSNELEMIDQERNAFKGGVTPSIAETTDEDDDDDDTDTEEFDPSGESHKSGSGEKKKRKGWKKSRKEKKERRKSKKQNAHIINNKVSPSQSVEDEKAPSKSKKVRRFASAKAKIFWKRGSKENNSEASPTKPERQSSGKVERSFSFVDDNPRSHQVPTADAPQQSPSTHHNEGYDTSNRSNPTRTSTRSFGDSHTVRTPMTAKTPLEAIVRDSYFDPPPPPPQAHRGRQNYRRSQSTDDRTNNPSTIATSAATQNHQSSATSKHRNENSSPSPPPRRRAPFPRTRGMMPTLVNSKREIVIAGESSRMQISTLTLDTALPSADAGSILEEVTNKSITDKCKERGTYTGTVNETDDPEGFGTMIYTSGAFYKGYWKEGHWHGHGILRTPNGDSYEGDFVYDCRHGRGIYKYENGDVYEGDFSSDKRHGKGTFLFQSGSMYRGDFAYGNFHGYGWYEFEEGYYEGSWVEGVYEGIGSLSYKDGSHYTGRFKEGVADGMGEEVKPDGTKKRGIWRSGEFLGQEENPDQHAPQGPLDSSVLSV